jgi:hypothetical protein
MLRTSYMKCTGHSLLSALWHKPVSAD